MLAEIALALTSLGQCGVLVYMIKKHSDELRRLSAAHFQAKGYGDAARREMQPDPKHVVEEQVKLAREARESGAGFSAQNPFGHKKPVGL
jgi:hypothetical protein